MQVYYTAHHNWRWVAQMAFQQMEKHWNDHYGEEDSKICCVECSRSRDLPSNRNVKSKAEYSLIRLDLVFKNEKCIKIRMDSPAMSFMDPKDILYRTLLAGGAEHTMPRTYLLPWDTEDIPNFLSFPAMLKAPLGSGGFGLYFVFAKEDVYEVMKNHRLRAKKEEKTIENIEKAFYSEYPLSWSLQELVLPQLCSVPGDEMATRKSQVRAYVVECNGSMYMYNTIEVRLPSWDVDLSQTLAAESKKIPVAVQKDVNEVPKWSDPVENECCGNSNARPYNEKRNKGDTERYLLKEISELVSSEKAIRDCVMTAFTALAPKLSARADAYQLLKQQSSPTRADEVSLSVVGIDLLVRRKETSDDEFEALIVEVNNNPAMPGSAKQMSPAYRQHLIDFNQSIISLGLQHAELSPTAVTNEERDCLVHMVHNFVKIA